MFEDPGMKPSRLVRVWALVVEVLITETRL